MNPLDEFEKTMGESPDNMTLFSRDLERLINRYSLEQASNTPDFILAHYLMNCFEAYNSAVIKNKEWHGSTPIGGINHD